MKGLQETFHSEPGIYESFRVVAETVWRLQGPWPQGMTGLLEYREDIRRYPRMLITSVFIRFDEIVLISKDKYRDKDGKAQAVKTNYVWFLRETGENFFHFRSLSELERILPPQFVRINQKYIINITSGKFEGKVNGSGVSVAGKILTVSDTYRKTFEERLSMFYI